jgi:uncharacterized membrane protein YsdA (DUF1294 family)
MTDVLVASGLIAVMVVSYLVVVNLIAYAMMVFDKTKAKNGTRRIPESTLLNLAFIGGSVGIVVAQQTSRHKTRKEPFRSKLIGILVLQVLALLALVVTIMMSGSPEALWELLVSELG